MVRMDRDEINKAVYPMPRKRDDHMRNHFKYQAITFVDSNSAAWSSLGCRE
jgi:hypothetical protein